MPIRDYAARRAGDSYSALLLAPRSLGISHRRTLRMQEFNDLDCAPEGNPSPAHPERTSGQKTGTTPKPGQAPSDTRGSRGLARKPPATVRPSEKRVASTVCAWYESADPTVPSVSSF